MMNQKELKQKYAEILAADVWGQDSKMIEFCVKEAGHIVELENGDIIPIKKPNIEKNFCFGYRDSRYDTVEYDRANAAADHAKKSVDYFLKENLKGINEKIAMLEGKDADRIEFRIRIPYNGQPENSQLKTIDQYYRWDDRGQSKYQLLEGEDLQRVIEGYKIVKAAFEKRLASYLKRYGLSKVHSWSYWQDA